MRRTLLGRRSSCAQDRVNRRCRPDYRLPALAQRVHLSAYNQRHQLTCQSRLSSAVDVALEPTWAHRTPEQQHSPASSPSTSSYSNAPGSRYSSSESSRGSSVGNGLIGHTVNGRYYEHSVQLQQHSSPNGHVPLQQHHTRSQHRAHHRPQRDPGHDQLPAKSLDAVLQRIHSATNWYELRASLVSGTPGARPDLVARSPDVVLAVLRRFAAVVQYDMSPAEGTTLRAFLERWLLQHVEALQFMGPQELGTCLHAVAKLQGRMALPRHRHHHQQQQQQGSHRGRGLGSMDGEQRLRGGGVQEPGSDSDAHGWDVDGALPPRRWTQAWFSAAQPYLLLLLDGPGAPASSDSHQNGTGSSGTGSGARAGLVDGYSGQGPSGGAEVILGPARVSQGPYGGAAGHAGVEVAVGPGLGRGPEGDAEDGAGAARGWAGSGGFRPRDLATCLWAAGKLQLQRQLPPAAMQLLLEACVPHMHRFNPQDLAMVATALCALRSGARAGVGPAGLGLGGEDGDVSLQQLLRSPALQRYGGSSGSSGGGVAAVPLPSGVWQAAFASRCAAVLRRPDCGPQAISNLLHGAVHAGLELPYWLLGEFCAAAYGRLSEFQPQALANVLSALAVRRHRPSAEWAERFFAESAARMGPSLGPGRGSGGGYGSSEHVAAEVDEGEADEPSGARWAERQGWGQRQGRRGEWCNAEDLAHFAAATARLQLLPPRWWLARFMAAAEQCAAATVGGTFPGSQGGGPSPASARRLSQLLQGVALMHRHAVAEAAAAAATATAAGSGGTGGGGIPSWAAYAAASAAASRPPQSLMRAWHGAAAAAVPYFNLVDASYSLWALAALGEQPPAGWLTALLQRCRPLLAVAAAPGPVALLLWALAALRFRPSWSWLSDVLDATSGNTSSRCSSGAGCGSEGAPAGSEALGAEGGGGGPAGLLQRMDGRDAAMLCGALVRLGCRPGGAWGRQLLAALAGRGGVGLRRLGLRCLAQTCWALYRLRVQPPPEWLEACVEAAAGEMGRIRGSEDEGEDGEEEVDPGAVRHGVLLAWVVSRWLGPQRAGAQRRRLGRMRPERRLRLQLRPAVLAPSSGAVGLGACPLEPPAAAVRPLATGHVEPMARAAAPERAAPAGLLRSGSSGSLVMLERPVAASAAVVSAATATAPPPCTTAPADPQPQQPHRRCRLRLSPRALRRRRATATAAAAGRGGNLVANLDGDTAAAARLRHRLGTRILVALASVLTAPAPAFPLSGHQARRPCLVAGCSAQDLAMLSATVASLPLAARAAARAHPSLPNALLDAALPFLQSTAPSCSPSPSPAPVALHDAHQAHEPHGPFAIASAMPATAITAESLHTLLRGVSALGVAPAPVWADACAAAARRHLLGAPLRPATARVALLRRLCRTALRSACPGLRAELVAATAGELRRVSFARVQLEQLLLVRLRAGLWLRRLGQAGVLQRRPGVAHAAAALAAALRAPPLASGLGAGREQTWRGQDQGQGRLRMEVLAELTALKEGVRRLAAACGSRGVPQLGKDQLQWTAARARRAAGALVLDRSPLAVSQLVVMLAGGARGQGRGQRQGQEAELLVGGGSGGNGSSSRVVLAEEGQEVALLLPWLAACTRVSWRRMPRAHRAACRRAWGVLLARELPAHAKAEAAAWAGATGAAGDRAAGQEPATARDAALRAAVLERLPFRTGESGAWGRGAA